MDWESEKGKQILAYFDKIESEQSSLRQIVEGAISSSFKNINGFKKEILYLLSVEKREDLNREKFSEKIAFGNNQTQSIIMMERPSDGDEDEDGKGTSTKEYASPHEFKKAALHRDDSQSVIGHGINDNDRLPVSERTEESHINIERREAEKKLKESKESIGIPNMIQREVASEQTQQIDRCSFDSQNKISQEEQNLSRNKQENLPVSDDGRIVGLDKKTSGLNPVQESPDIEDKVKITREGSKEKPQSKDFSSEKIDTNINKDNFTSNNKQVGLLDTNLQSYGKVNTNILEKIETPKKTDNNDTNVSEQKTFTPVIGFHAYRNSLTEAKNLPPEKIPSSTSPAQNSKSPSTSEIKKVTKQTYSIQKSEIKTPGSEIDPSNNLPIIQNKEESKDVNEIMKKEKEIIKKDIFTKWKTQPDCVQKYLMLVKGEIESCNQTDFAKIEPLVRKLIERFEKVELEIHNSVSKQKIELLKTSFDNKNETDLLYNVNGLLKIVRPLNVEEIEALIEINEKASSHISGKNIVLLIGKTGTGKSTSIHYLAGSKFEKNTVKGINNIGAVSNEENPDILKNITISPLSQSETRNLIAVPKSLNDPCFEKLKKHKNIGNEIVLCDSPGLGDNRSSEVDIANGVALNKTICQANSVLPVILISYDDIGSRFQGFRDSVMEISRIIPNFAKYENSFSFLFSKFNEETKNEFKVKLGEIFKNINEYQHLNNTSIRISLDIMNNTFDYSDWNDFFPDPLDCNRNPNNLLLKILSKSPIKNPENSFSEFICDSSKEVSKNQFEICKKSLLAAIKRGEHALAELRIDEIKGLGIIFQKSKLFKRDIEQLIEEIGRSFMNELNADKQNLNLAKDKVFSSNDSILKAYVAKIERMKNFDQFLNKVSSFGRVSLYNFSNRYIENMEILVSNIAQNFAFNDLKKLRYYLKCFEEVVFFTNEFTTEMKSPFSNRYQKQMEVKISSKAKQFIQILIKLVDTGDIKTLAENMKAVNFLLNWNESSKIRLFSGLSEILDRLIMKIKTIKEEITSKVYGGISSVNDLEEIEEKYKFLNSLLLYSDFKSFPKVQQEVRLQQKTLIDEMDKIFKENYKLASEISKEARIQSKGSLFLENLSKLSFGKRQWKMELLEIGDFETDKVRSTFRDVKKYLNRAFEKQSENVVENITNAFCKLKEHPIIMSKFSEYIKEEKEAIEDKYGSKIDLLCEKIKLMNPKNEYELSKIIESIKILENLEKLSDFPVFSTLIQDTLTAFKKNYDNLINKILNIINKNEFLKMSQKEQKVKWDVFFNRYNLLKVYSAYNGCTIFVDKIISEIVDFHSLNIDMAKSNYDFFMTFLEKPEKIKFEIEERYIEKLFELKSLSQLEEKDKKFPFVRRISIIFDSMERDINTFLKNTNLDDVYTLVNPNNYYYYSHQSYYREPDLSKLNEYYTKFCNYFMLFSDKSNKKILGKLLSCLEIKYPNLKSHLQSSSYLIESYTLSDFINLLLQKFNYNYPEDFLYDLQKIIYRYIQCIIGKLNYIDQNWKFEIDLAEKFNEICKFRSQIVSSTSLLDKKTEFGIIKGNFLDRLNETFKKIIERIPPLIKKATDFSDFVRLEKMIHLYDSIRKTVNMYNIFPLDSKYYNQNFSLNDIIVDTGKKYLKSLEISFSNTTSDKLVSFISTLKQNSKYYEILKTFVLSLISVFDKKIEKIKDEVTKEKYEDLSKIEQIISILPYEFTISIKERIKKERFNTASFPDSINRTIAKFIKEGDYMSLFKYYSETSNILDDNDAVRKVYEFLNNSLSTEIERLLNEYSGSEFSPSSVGKVGSIYFNLKRYLSFPLILKIQNFSDKIVADASATFDKIINYMENNETDSLSNSVLDGPMLSFESFLSLGKFIPDRNSLDYISYDERVKIFENKLFGVLQTLHSDLNELLEEFRFVETILFIDTFKKFKNPNLEKIISIFPLELKERLNSIYNKLQHSERKSLLLSKISKFEKKIDEFIENFLKADDSMMISLAEKTKIQSSVVGVLPFLKESNELVLQKLKDLFNCKYNEAFNLLTKFNASSFEIISTNIIFNQLNTMMNYFVEIIPIDEKYSSLGERIIKEFSETKVLRNESGKDLTKFSEELLYFNRLKIYSKWIPENLFDLESLILKNIKNVSDIHTMAQLLNKDNEGKILIQNLKIFFGIKKKPHNSPEFTKAQDHEKEIIESLNKINDKQQLKEFIETTKSTILAQLTTQKPDLPCITAYQNQEIPDLIFSIFALWNALNLDINYFLSSKIIDYIIWPDLVFINNVRNILKSNNGILEKSLIELKMDIEDYSFTVVIISILCIIFGFEVDLAFNTVHQADIFRSKYLNLFNKLDLEQFINIDTVKNLTLADHYLIQEKRFTLTDFTVTPVKESNIKSNKRPKFFILFEADTLFYPKVFGKTKNIFIQINNEKFDKLIKKIIETSYYLYGKSLPFLDDILKTEEARNLLQSKEAQDPNIRNFLINNIKRAVFELSELRNLGRSNSSYQSTVHRLLVKKQYAYFDGLALDRPNDPLKEYPINQKLGTLSYIDSIIKYECKIGFCKNYRAFTSVEQEFLKNIYNRVFQATWQLHTPEGLPNDYSVFSQNNELCVNQEKTLYKTIVENIKRIFEKSQHNNSPLIIFLKSKQEILDFSASKEFKPFSDNSREILQTKDVSEIINLLKSTANDKPIFLAKLKKRVLISLSNYFAVNLNFILAFPIQNRWGSEIFSKYFENKKIHLNIIKLIPESLFKKHSSDFELLENDSSFISEFNNHKKNLQEEHMFTVSLIKNLINKQYIDFLQKIRMENTETFEKENIVTIFISNDINRFTLLHHLKCAFLKLIDTKRSPNTETLFRFVLLSKYYSYEDFKLSPGEYDFFRIYTFLQRLLEESDVTNPSDIFYFEELAKFIFKTQPTNAIIYAGGTDYPNSVDVKTILSKYNQSEFQYRLHLYYFNDIIREVLKEMCKTKKGGKLINYDKKYFSNEFLSFFNEN